MNSINLLLTIILTAIAIGAGVIKGVQIVMRNMLVSEGLIRPGKPETHWPNGWHSLPDTLQGIYDVIQEHHGDDA